MKKLTITRLLALTILLALASCGNKTAYQESVTLPADTWLRFEPRELSLDIANTEDCYEIYVEADIDTSRYREEALPLTFKMTSNQGETRTFFASLMLRSKDGHTLGQPAEGGYLHYRQRVKEYFYFNVPGQHTLSIGQRTSRYEIKGIHRVGIIIQKAQLEYPK